ncbi:PD-(D/E)XK nuclease family protein [Pseudobacter ginsenosidimutans]|uniref:PD-(D/E)XK nuclease superfamily protein n=1 Tax=Pseudobacter ginsenosidimutans TaxID=661488 RepID=A0A4Q7MWH8_9BACT|nr:PD-(D/E)XK nuclease family protein [Pseudobacter ginsenosidimutans]RZS71513.1 PD-(D/E)XK nuclease superfamily protein [Pseudobacter ginsenosidimutans]
MNKITSIRYNQIKRISPSQFSAMKNCAYKLVLAEAFDKRYLLPLSPNAYLGTLFHKLLEQITRHQIKTEDELNQRFSAELQTMEEKLILEGNGFYTPLQNNVKDFGIKKIQLKKYLLTLPTGTFVANKKYISEKWFQTTDGVLGGKIDLIIEDNDETEIIDFKTGSITMESLDDDGEIVYHVKEEYQEQIKLYAFLYSESTKRTSLKLNLVNLAKQKYSVDFTPEECSVLYQEARGLLDKINLTISELRFETIANPSAQNCRFCLFRPACSYYIEYLKIDKSFNDVTGVVTNTVTYMNGNISIDLDCNGEKITITGFGEEKSNYLNLCKGKTLNIFNLNKSMSGNIYTATKTTIIYE